MTSHTHVNRLKLLVQLDLGNRVDELVGFVGKTVRLEYRAAVGIKRVSVK